MGSQSDWEKFKSNPEAYAKAAAPTKSAKPWDFFNPNTEYASKEESSRRLEICKTCPFLIKSTIQCKKCGCFMKAKTTLAHATCPVGNW